MSAISIRMRITMYHSRRRPWRPRLPSGPTVAPGMREWRAPVPGLHTPSDTGGDSVAAPAGMQRIGTDAWELGADYRPGMRVPVRVFASEKLLAEMDAKVFEQAANVATLPGIVEASFCMPDAHWGYGFPIGGVAAMDVRSGVISPGGIGFDINCGMRLARTDLTWSEVKPRLAELVDGLAARVPAGAGQHGLVRVGRSAFREVLEKGARWAVEQGYGTPDDLARTEAGGCFAGADPDCVSARAVERGHRQIGTLGSGNHYLEIQVLHPEGVFDPKLARVFGLDLPEQVVVMFHCGSRGFGHQVATDYLHDFLRAMPTKFGLPVIDRELACAPFDSREGRAYYAAMCCAANMSFANRQVILHQVREVFSEVFRRGPEKLGIRQVYDVAHNMAKLEEHGEGRARRKLLVHRKGATRAFPPGHPELPPEYREVGQPVIIGGSMETGSYLLAGSASGAGTFFSTAHGSGRTMSRTLARKRVRGHELRDRMAARGILVRSASWRGLAEEAGFAYKDVDEVAAATEEAGLSRRVAHLVQVDNIKG
jgi:tRNA-splicing ligase RtcB (3'-phosphate/5'-hydroxy nucleic acid ligase)